MTKTATRHGRQVIRKCDLKDKFQCGKTKIDDMIAAGLIRVFPLSPGGRAKVAFEDECDDLLERMAALSGGGERQRHG